MEDQPKKHVRVISLRIADFDMSLLKQKAAIL